VLDGTGLADQDGWPQETTVFIRHHKRKCPTIAGHFLMLTALNVPRNYLFFSPSTIRSIPRLLVAMETTIPIKKIPIGTKSSIGMLYLPTLLLDLRFAETAPRIKNINYWSEV
jgi:hypothetical protein